MQFEITITLHLRPTHKVLPPFPPILGWKPQIYHSRCAVSTFRGFPVKAAQGIEKSMLGVPSRSTRSLSQRIGHGVIWVREHGDSSSRSTGHRKHRDIVDGNARLLNQCCSSLKSREGKPTASQRYRAFCSSPTQPLSLSIAGRVYPATVSMLHLDTSRRRQIQSFLSQWLMACAIETAPGSLSSTSSFCVVRFLDRFSIYCARCSTTNNTILSPAAICKEGNLRSDSHLQFLMELFLLPE
jgi:hypothetical protein